MVTPWVIWSHGFKYHLLFSRSVVSDSLWSRGLQHTRPPCPSPTPRVYSNSCPSNLWCHPTISSSVIPFPCPQSFPASGSFPVSRLFPSGGQSIGASASVLSMNIQDSQESSPTPYFKSINSSALSLLYGPILTSIHDYWKNHSFDYTDLCQQSNVSIFLIHCLGLQFFFQGASVNFMAAVTVFSDLGAQ